MFVPLRSLRRAARADPRATLWRANNNTPHNTPQTNNTDNNHNHNNNINILIIT